MKTLKILLLFIIYIFSNALVVHAFAMHGDHQGQEESHHCNTEKETVQEHDDSDGHHDKDNESNESPAETNYLKCLENVKDVFSSSYDSIQELTTAFHYPVIYTSVVDLSIVSTNVYHHDPGWGQHGNFAAFIDQLYGHGVIMHC